VPNNDEVFFDAQWKREGFCVAGTDSPYMNSHDVCFYCDMVMALVLSVMYVAFGRNTRGMESANKYAIANVVGMIAHGIGHGAVSGALRRDDNDLQVLETESRRSLCDPLQHDDQALLYIWLRDQVPLALFWLGLIYACMPSAKKGVIAAFAFAANVGQSFVPLTFGFTYVQTVLFAAASFRELSLPLKEKTFAYATNPLMIGLPKTAMAWLESTEFVKDKFYGHLMYDGYIAVSCIVWYLVNYIKARDEKELQKLKKL
jgi:hypothetical protein